MKTFHDQIADFITEQEKHNLRRKNEVLTTLHEEHDVYPEITRAVKNAQKKFETSLNSINDELRAFVRKTLVGKTITVKTPPAPNGDYDPHAKPMTVRVLDAGVHDRPYEYSVLEDDVWIKVEDPRRRKPGPVVWSLNIQI